MINSEITFRKLEILLAFMEKRNIARTAEHLDLSGVSVHRALHSLEKGLRCPLFIHKGRDLLPMSSAHTLAEYAKEMVSLMERGIKATQNAAGFSENRLKIGTMYSLTLETIPKLIMGLKVSRPQLEIELVMGSNKALITKLEEQQLDVILISDAKRQVDTNYFITLPLLKDEIFLAAPASSKLISETPINLRDLRHEKFVALTEGFATYKGFSGAFEIAGFEPDIVAHVNDIFSMVSLVQAGVGYTLLPGRMKRVYESSLRLLPLSEPYRMQQTISLVFPRNREHDPNLSDLIIEGTKYAKAFKL